MACLGTQFERLTFSKLSGRQSPCNIKYQVDYLWHDRSERQNIHQTRRAQQKLIITMNRMVVIISSIPDATAAPKLALQGLGVAVMVISSDDKSCLGRTDSGKTCRLPAQGAAVS
jgi:hypothetical protein